MKRLLNALLCNAFREAPPDAPLLPQAPRRIEQPQAEQKQLEHDPQVYFRLSTLFRVQIKSQAQYYCEQIANCFLTTIGADGRLTERPPQQLPRIDYYPQICMLLQKLPAEDRKRMVRINNGNQMQLLRAVEQAIRSFKLSFAEHALLRLEATEYRLCELGERLYGLKPLQTASSE